MAEHLPPHGKCWMNSCFAFSLPLKLSLSQSMSLLTFTLPILFLIPSGEDEKATCVGLSCWLELNHGTLLLHKRKSDKCFTHCNFHLDHKSRISEKWSLKALLYGVYIIRCSARLCWRFYTARLCPWGRRQLIYSTPEAFSVLLPSSLQVPCSLLAPSTCLHSASPSVYFSAAGAGITLTGRLCGSAASHCDLLH